MKTKPTKQAKPPAPDADDLDLSWKDVYAGDPIVPRKEWAEKNLTWEGGEDAWRIPGTDYHETWVTKVNHRYMADKFPWLEERGGKLYLSPEQLDWMPLWNPFKDCVAKALHNEVISEDYWEELEDEVIKESWQREYATQFAELLADRFGDRLRAVEPLKEFITFCHSDAGFKYFSHLASDCDENWELDQVNASINLDKVVENVDWPDLKAAMYPLRNQLPLGLDDEPAQPQQLDMFESGALDDEGDDISAYLHDIKLEQPAEIRQWFQDNLEFNDYADLWVLESYSDYSGSLVDQANAQYWLQEYPDLVKTEHGGMGTVWVGIKPEALESLDVETAQKIQKAWKRKENYPLLNDEIHSELEEEAKQKAWDGWLKKEFQDELVKKFPDWEEAIEVLMDDDQAQAMFDAARDLAGAEWCEEDGGNMHVHGWNRVPPLLTRDFVRRWLFPEADYRQLRLNLEALLEEGYDYSCVLALAPSQLADAVIKWGQMNILDEEVFEGEGREADQYGRETEPHVTVKFGLHESRPSRELLRIIEETQPFEIEVGAASLFESDEYDVLKFDVEGEALRALNARISAELTCTDTHPQFHPHITIAYIQKGACRELVGKYLLEADAPDALRFLVKSVVFAGKGEAHDAARLKVHLFLGKPNLEVE